jgi:hypothetical protein
MMADPDGELLEMVKMLAVQIPEMVILLLGMIVAIMNWSRYPRPALMSFFGCGILLLLTVATEAVYFLVPRHWGPGFDGELFFLAVGGARSLLAAGALLLLIFAVYAGRRPRPPLPPYPAESHDEPRA